MRPVDSQITGVLVGVILTFLYACGVASTPAPEAEVSGQVSENPNKAYVQVEVLSQGRGVPAPAWSAYQDIRTLVEQHREQGAEISVYEEVIGLEGERRMCIEIKSTGVARSIRDEVNAKARNVDLIRVSFAPCADDSDQTEEEQKHER